jgi:hypothetical protein
MYFPALQASQIENGKLTEMIASLGGHYPAAIPYLALFDRAGRLTRETANGVSASGVLVSAKSQMRPR